MFLILDKKSLIRHQKYFIFERYIIKKIVAIEAFSFTM